MAEINLINNLNVNHINDHHESSYSKEDIEQQNQLNYSRQQQSYQSQTNCSNTNSSSNKNVEKASKIDNYQIKKKIGSGNFAVVRLAVHIPTNAKVAMKIIDKRKTNHDNMKKIYREIEIMKKIDNHKNIIKLYQVLETEDHLFLITDYCEGGELFDYLISNGRLKENQARFLFIQILDAVEYLHDELHVCHRDLKAENLLLSEDKKTIKLADFGFSNYYNGDLLNTFCGSLPYASPELFQGKEYNGQKSDIWSLGVVLYALVCGALPFGKDNLHDLKNSILNGTYRIPFWLSEDCEELIKNMLVVEPEKRFSIQQIKNHKWMKHLKEELNESYEISQTIGNLDKLNISYNDDDEDEEELLKRVKKLAARFSNCDIEEFMDSVMNKKFDNYYALYHLDKDFFGTNASSQQSSTSNLLISSPLLPVIAAGQHRKSSITTGIVERENSDQTIYDQTIYDQPSHLNTNLLNAINAQRRHTFGPESSSTTNLNLITKPTPLFSLTPPNDHQHYPLINYNNTNLNIVPSNLPLIQNMDLLKPPQVFEYANNNMLRRASDGQANYYTNDHFRGLSMDSDQDYALSNGSNSDLDNQAAQSQHLSSHHNNSLFELNNNQYSYSLNDHSHQTTPSPPLQFQSSFYQPQFQSPSSPYHSFNSPSSSQQRGSPYSSGNLDLKDKSNYLRRKRHSLTETFDLATRRKVHNTAALTGLNNSSTNFSINTANANNTNNLNNPHHSPCLPIYKDLNKRRASEGSGQLLQQLTPQFRTFGNDNLSPLSQQLVQKNLLLSPYSFANAANNSNNQDSNVLNFLSNSSINQVKNVQQQMQSNQTKQTNSQKLPIRSLCVSSPPSLQTSPIHQQINHLHTSTNQTPNQLIGYQKSQSPPCQSLQMISEETEKKLYTDIRDHINSLNRNIIELQQKTNHNQNTCSQTLFADYGLSINPITPPQSFRNDNLMNDQQSSNPQISITNYDGLAQPNEFNEFNLILQPPKPFAQPTYQFNHKYMHSNQQPDFNSMLMEHNYSDDQDQLNSNYHNLVWKDRKGSDERVSLLA